MKTVVPLQKKKEALMSNIRLSMNYRISLTYMKHLLINGIVFFAVFIVLYLTSEYHEYERLAGRVTERMMTTSSMTKSAGMAYFVNFSMPPEMPPMTMMQVSARKMTL